MSVKKTHRGVPFDTALTGPPSAAGTGFGTYTV